MAYTNKADQAAAARRHYEKNKNKFFDRSKAWNRKTREQVIEYLLGYLRQNPCIDCGEGDPIVLEFDHRDGAEKRFNIGDAKGSFSLSAVKAEVEKCDVRCANCHRRRTYKQRNYAHRG